MIFDLINVHNQEQDRGNTGEKRKKGEKGEKGSLKFLKKLYLSPFNLKKIGANVRQLLGYRD